MKAAKKILKFVVLPIIIVLVIACIVLYLTGGAILKTAVEKGAAKALGVGVTVDDIDLSILKGAVGIDGLTVQNPPGYAHENLLVLSQGRVTTSIGSLLSDTVRIKELKLDGLNLVIEQKALSNNLHQVISSIPAQDKQTEPEKGAKKLHIDNLELTNIKVNVKLLPLPGTGKVDTIPLNLSPIKMSNLGTDNKLSIGVLSTKILLAIAQGVAEQGVGVLPDDMVNTMKSALDKTLDVGKAATEEGKKIIDAGADVVEGFKGLLKPKKEEE